MNRGPFIFLGLFCLFAFAWAKVIDRPIRYSAGVQEVVRSDGTVGPPQLSAPRVQGGSAQGRIVYQELGCVACHTQVTRLEVGMDVERDYGSRQSVVRDYLGSYPALIGNRRLGADLGNVGNRRTDPTWHYQHLYNPLIVSKGSNMPPFPFLFERRKIIGQPSANALELPAPFAAQAGYEVVPTSDARALVAYLLNLKNDYDLEEAPKPISAMAEQLAEASQGSDE